MKNCDEMVNSLLERREQYETKQKRKRKVLVRTVTPICSVCLIALLGFGMWQGGMFSRTLSEPQKDDSVYVSDSENSMDLNDTPSSSNDLIDVIGMVKVNDVTYVQLSTNTKIYTPDTCLGDASDFEGTYQTYLRDISAKLYTTKEDSDVLMVKLENGDFVVLAKEKN